MVLWTQLAGATHLIQDQYPTKGGQSCWIVQIKNTLLTFVGRNSLIQLFEESAGRRLIKISKYVSTAASNQVS